MAMQLVSKLRCGLRGGQNFEAFYANLSTEELKRRKRSMVRQVWIINLIWVASMLIVGVLDQWEPVYLWFFGSTFLSVNVTTFSDLRRRWLMIQRILRERDQEA